MSSIQRYKKSGGFFQLLSLIETFGVQKREKFVEMIEAESPVWARALREKMLSVERIFAWPDQVIIEVIKGLPTKNMAVALEGLKEDQKARMLVFFTPLDRRRLEDALLDKPKPEEITANLVKVVELARKMLSNGDLRAEKFDEGLQIPEEFESKLEAMAGQAYAEKVGGAMPSTPAAGSSDVGSHDLGNLQRTLASVAKENKTLKDEVRLLRDKLEQIRKIA